jgi:Flp pilus assembly pilin Flp
VEYALLLALIAVACIVAVSLLGGSLNNSYSKDASSVAATPG